MALTSALLKSQIEAELARRIPAALSPMARQETVRQALAAQQLNALLGGGIPAGAITEVHGPAFSGRTSFACSLASAVTTGGNVAAWVDVADAFDPESAALSGVDLQRLLWVRCGNPSTQKECVRGHADGAAKQPSVSPNLLVETHAPRPVSSGGGSPHPRSEGRGMPEAIDTLLQRRPEYAAIPARRAHKQIGTPGMPNRDVTAALHAAESPCSVSHHTATVIASASRFPNGRDAAKAQNIVAPDEIVSTNGRLFGRQVGRAPMPFPHASPYREEQIPTDRQPSRRLQKAPVAEAKPKPCAAMRKVDATAPARPGTGTAESWAPLDQALRTVDLLLQAGGFSLLVLDLGSVPANMAWRIPLATWFRFRAGCERSRASLLVISQHPCARASADLTVAMETGKIQVLGGTVAVGSTYRLQVEQQRRGVAPSVSNVVSFRKPVRADHGASAASTWSAAGAWSVRA